MMSRLGQKKKQIETQRDWHTDDTDQQKCMKWREGGELKEKSQVGIKGVDGKLDELRTRRRYWRKKNINPETWSCF